MTCGLIIYWGKLITVVESRQAGSICCGSWCRRHALSASSHWPASCTDAQTSVQTPCWCCTSGEKPQKQMKLKLNCVAGNQTPGDTYLIKDFRVPRVEQAGQPLLYRSDHLGPHRVYEEIITWHCVSSVAAKWGNITCQINLPPPVDSLFIPVPADRPSSHLSKQSTVMRNKLQQSGVHLL